MNCHFLSNNIQSALEWARCAERAAEMVHCACLATKDATRIHEASDSGDWSRMWTVLQTCLARCKFLIAASSPLTGVTVVRLSPDQVAKLTIADLVVQLRIVTGFVFVDHALRSTARLSFRERFQKLAKSSTTPIRFKSNRPTLTHSGKQS